MVESDKDFRVRIINAYGMWGALCTVILESSGKDLEEIALFVHPTLKRLGVYGQEKAD